MGTIDTAELLGNSRRAGARRDDLRINRSRLYLNRYEEADRPYVSWIFTLGHIQQLISELLNFLF